SDGDLPAQHDECGDENRYADNGDGGVLAVQIGAGAFLDRRGDLLHLLGAGAESQQLLHEPTSIEERYHAAGENEGKLQAHIPVLIWMPVFGKGKRALPPTGWERPQT